MKKIIALVVSLLLISSAFADNWVNRGTFHNDEAGDYAVSWYLGYEKPLENNVGNFVKIMNKLAAAEDCYTLQFEYYEKENVGNWWITSAAKKNCFLVVETYKAYSLYYFYLEDGSVFIITKLYCEE